MGKTITVAAVQTGPVLSDDMKPGVENACRLVEQAASHGVDIVCFSELFLTPFFPNRLAQDYEKWFLELPSPVTEPLFAVAREKRLAMIFPFGERAGAYFYNAAAVVDREGRITGTYHKTHIPAILPSGLEGGTGSYEKFYFTPGESLPVFDLEGVSVGIQICYDRKFPEGSRSLALDGAKIIFMPICAASYGDTKARVDTWALPLQARAYENGVFVVAVNRAGDEHGRKHIARSMIVDPFGAIIKVSETDGNELVLSTLDLELVDRAQKSLPWWRDRRAELYGRLTKQ